MTSITYPDLSFCPCCGTMKMFVETRLRNTAYVDDKLNWLYSCEACYLEDYAYFEERWNDYYSDVL